MDVFLVTKQMMILFSMIAIGYMVYRLNGLGEDSASRLSGLVVNIFNPFLMISSVFGKSFSSTGNLFWENLILVGIFYLILFLAGFLLVALLRPDSAESPVYRLLTLLPNCGFMGIPVVSSLLGTQYIIYVAVYMLAYNIILYTYGIYLVRKGNPGNVPPTTFFQKIRPIIFNPGVIASVIALFIFFSGIPVADGVQSFCCYMGNPCIPLSMLLIGCSLASSNILSMLKKVKIYGFLLFKMLMIPIACTFLARLLPFDNMILKLFLLMLSMPAGSMVVLVAEKYGGKEDCAAGGVVLSTLASIITIPVVSIFLP